MLACSCRGHEYEQKVRCSEKKVAVRKASEVTRVYTTRVTRIRKRE